MASPTDNKGNKDNTGDIKISNNDNNANIKKNKPDTNADKNDDKDVNKNKASYDDNDVNNDIDNQDDDLKINDDDNDKDLNNDNDDNSETVWDRIDDIIFCCYDFGNWNLYQNTVPQIFPSKDNNYSYLWTDKLENKNQNQNQNKIDLDLAEELLRKITIHRGSITDLNIDAIVNAANNGLWGGAGVCGAIFRAAGDRKLQKECDNITNKYGSIPTGLSVITSGCKLSAKYCIHSVGPTSQDNNALKSCYITALKLCIKHNIKSIAFPCISTGIFGFSKQIACPLALTAVKQWLINSKDIKYKDYLKLINEEEADFIKTAKKRKENNRYRWGMSAYDNDSDNDSDNNDWNDSDNDNDNGAKTDNDINMNDKTNDNDKSTDNKPNNDDNKPIVNDNNDKMDLTNDNNSNDNDNDGK